MFNQFTFPFLGISFKFPKFAFFIGDYGISWNLFFMILGILAGVLVFWLSMRKKKSDSEVYTIALVSLLVGFVVTRLIGVPLTNAASLHNSSTVFYPDFPSMLDIGDGNMPVYFGIIFGVITAKWMCNSRKRRFSDFSDTVVYPLIIGLIIGRIGDFFAQSYIGMPTTAALGLKGNLIDDKLLILRNGILENKPGTLNIVYVPGASVHPLAIYEIMACIIIFLIIGMIKKKQFFRGELFMGFIVLYGGVRAILENNRIDIKPFGLLRPNQLIGAICFAAGIIAWLVMRWQTKEGNLRDINLYHDTVHDDGYGNQSVKKQHTVYTATDNEKLRKFISQKDTPAENAPDVTRNDKKSSIPDRIDADISAINEGPVVYTADDDEKLENIASVPTPIKTTLESNQEDKK